MKRRIKYTDEPMEIEIIDDPLPSPQKIRLRLRNMKSTAKLGASKAASYRKKAGRRSGV